MSKTSFTREQEKDLRRIGHSLKPTVLMGGSGITDGLITEITRALTDHELIKIKVTGEDKKERQDILIEITVKTGATVIQSVGKMALIYKKNLKANPRLSNIARYDF